MDGITPTDFGSLCAEARACKLCAADLPLGPRPVFALHPSARLLIIGQAPGTKVHASGIPWQDASGQRLRAWLGVSDAQFYNPEKVAIMPMGLCYPGRYGPDSKGRSGGDLPPRPECAPRWHGPLRGLLPEIDLTLLVGHYAQRYYLANHDLGIGPVAKASMGAIVAAYDRALPHGFLPLPHPSWRTTGWEKQNPWFTEALLPSLRARVAGYFAC